MKSDGLKAAHKYYQNGSLAFYLHAIIQFIFYRFFSNKEEMKAGWKTDIATIRLDLKSAMRKVEWSESDPSRKAVSQNQAMLEEDIYPLS